MMADIFSIQNLPAIVLLDLRASDRFISTKCVARHNFMFSHTKKGYVISTLGGKIASDQIVQKVTIKMGSKLYDTTLITLDNLGLDIILGINWMKEHGVLLCSEGY